MENVIQEQKLNTIKINHWKNKFEKSIDVLLKSGITLESLIEEIKIISNKQ